MKVVVGLLALCGLPLFVVIALMNMLSYSQLGFPNAVMFNDIAELTDKAHLLPIPLFTFAGFLLARSNAPDRLVKLAEAALGWLPGGLAIVAICACTFFTTFTGASGVTIIALGGLLYPVLVERKYPEQFSLGLLTSSGSLGLLFFPALPVFIFAVVYGISTESAAVTPEGLFLAGFIPGIILTGVLCVYAWFVGERLHIERTPFSGRALLSAFREAFWEAILPVVLVGMVLSGWVSLNEIATLTCVYLLAVEMLLHRDIHPTRDLPKLVGEAMVLVGAIILIMAMVLPANDLLKDQRVPQRILEWFSQFVDSKIGFLIVLNLFLIVVGCLMDIFSAIVAVLPLLIPLAERYDVEPLHLGVIFLANLEIGYLTPPVGINLFISSFQFRKPVLTVYRSVIPFIGLLFGALLLFTYVPALSTALPNHFLEAPMPDLISPFTQAEMNEDADLSAEELKAKYLDDDDDDGDLDGGSGDLDDGDLDDGDLDDGDLDDGDLDDGDLDGDLDDGDLDGDSGGDLLNDGNLEADDEPASPSKTAPSKPDSEPDSEPNPEDDTEDADDGDLLNDGNLEAD